MRFHKSGIFSSSNLEAKLGGGSEPAVSIGAFLSTSQPRVLACVWDSSFAQDKTVEILIPIAQPSLQEVAGAAPHTRTIRRKCWWCGAQRSRASQRRMKKATPVNHMPKSIGRRVGTDPVNEWGRVWRCRRRQRKPAGAANHQNQPLSRENGQWVGSRDQKSSRPPVGVELSS
jgi:hypothetical protein